tara:strand:- start:5329 stop:7113 length:1785 start_codon:yes stop_codon:yes gene_type:complete
MPDGQNQSILSRGFAAVGSAIGLGQPSAPANEDDEGGESETDASSQSVAESTSSESSGSEEEAGGGATEEGAPRARDDSTPSVGLESFRKQAIIGLNQEKKDLEERLHAEESARKGLSDRVRELEAEADRARNQSTTDLESKNAEIARLKDEKEALSASAATEKGVLEESVKQLREEVAELTEETRREKRELQARVDSERSAKESAQATVAALQARLNSTTGAGAALEVEEVGPRATSDGEESELAAGVQTFLRAADEEQAQLASEERRSKVAKVALGDSATGPRLDDAEDPLLVFGVHVRRSSEYQREPTTLDDATIEPGSQTTKGGGGTPPGRAEKPDETTIEVDDDEYRAIEASAISYVHRGPWWPDVYKQVSEADLQKSASEGKEYAFYGDLGNGRDNSLVIPFSKFVKDIRPFPAVRDDTHVVRSFMKEDDRQHLYIRLQKWRGDDLRADSVNVYRQNASGAIFRVSDFSLLSELFLRTKAEAMRLVRDVAKKAIGLDNDKRELVVRRANEIVSDTTWTLANVRPEAMGAATSLFDASRDAMEIRADLGRSWRSGPTVAMVQRTASTSALDFIREEIIRDVHNSAVQML